MRHCMSLGFITSPTPRPPPAYLQLSQILLCSPHRREDTQTQWKLPMPRALIQWCKIKARVVEARPGENRAEGCLPRDGTEPRGFRTSSPTQRCPLLKPAGPIQSSADTVLSISDRPGSHPGLAPWFEARAANKSKVLGSDQAFGLLGFIQARPVTGSWAGRGQTQLRQRPAGWQD